MSSIISSISVSFQQLPWLELIAMLLTLAYVFLAAKGSLWCWPAAFISTALYTFIFYDVLLLMDSALNAYYLVMAVYGYWQWSKNTSSQQHSSSPLAIVSWSARWHLKVCLILAVTASLVGYCMATYTQADFAYLDTFTTVYAIFATYLVTQKVLENWLYWIVINVVSIYLYIEKSLVPTTVLFVILVIVACYGYLKWLKLYKQSAITLQPEISS